MRNSQICDYVLVFFVCQPFESSWFILQFLHPLELTMVPPSEEMSFWFHNGTWEVCLCQEDDSSCTCRSLEWRPSQTATVDSDNYERPRKRQACQAAEEQWQATELKPTLGYCVFDISKECDDDDEIVSSMDQTATTYPEECRVDDRTRLSAILWEQGHSKWDMLTYQQFNVVCGKFLGSSIAAGEMFMYMSHGGTVVPCQQLFPYFLKGERDESIRPKNLEPIDWKDL